MENSDFFFFWLGGGVASISISLLMISLFSLQFTCSQKVGSNACLNVNLRNMFAAGKKCLPPHHHYTPLDDTSRRGAPFGESGNILQVWLER